MKKSCDYRQYVVLHVDDDERALKNLQMLCGDQFRIISASTADEGLQFLQEHQEEVGVLLADSCMRNHSGIWLLEQAREIKPAIARVLLSDGCQWDAVLSALRTGITRRIIPIPWEPGEIGPIIETELQVFMLQRERDLLEGDLRRVLADRLASLQNLSADLNIGVTEFLQIPRTFMDSLPLRLQANGVNMRDPRHADFWQDLYGNVNQQFARIDDVLKTLCRAVDEPASSETAQVNLRGLLHEALECLSAELQASQVTVEGIVPVDFPEIIAVAQKLQQILELLIKYKMARVAPPAKVQVIARLFRTGTFTGDELELEIGDTGPGPLTGAGRLPAKEAKMEADCRLNRVLSSIIVHQQGGRMKTHREAGKGTTFLIRLPVSRSES